MTIKYLQDYLDIELHKLPEWQLGWLAGMIDGEGCIHIGANGRPRVNIASTTQIGSVIKGITGIGSVYSDPPRSIEHKVIHRWTINSFAEIYTFLTKLLPYLILKKKQAELMIKFCSDKMDVMLRKRLELRKSVSEYISEFRVMNKRGVPDDD